jgi:hypothetical protein
MILQELTKQDVGTLIVKVAQIMEASATDGGQFIT